MATPDDPTTSHGSRDAVIAAYMQAVEAGEVPNRQRLGGECPRQELNLVLDLRGVVCESVTPPDLSSKAIAKQAKTALLLGAPRVAAQLVDRIRPAAVVRDVVEGLADRFQGHAVIAGELLGRIRVGLVNGLINDRGADAATLKEKLAIVGAGPRLQVLVPCGGRCRRGWSSNDLGSFYL